MPCSSHPRGENTFFVLTGYYGLLYSKSSGGIMARLSIPERDALEVLSKSIDKPGVDNYYVTTDYIARLCFSGDRRAALRALKKLAKMGLAERSHGDPGRWYRTGQPLYFCCCPSCPGLPYAASELPHPCGKRG